MRFSFNDLYSLFALLKTVIGFAAIIVPTYLLAVNTFRQLGRAPKDSYEAAYVAIAWLGLAWLLK